MNKLIKNAVVGQSGGPTSAINATLSGVIRGVLENRNDIGTLYGMKNGIEGFLAEDFVDLGAMFSDGNGLSSLETTPSSALGSCRKKLPDPNSGDPVYERIEEIFKKYDIGYFFYIGGNDSMDAVAKLSRYFEGRGLDIHFVGVPKTIDNDLCGTDHSPGYGSAAKYIAVTLQEIIRDCAVYRVPAVTIVEIMGRDAGWLTAAAAAGRRASGFEPDLVYLPERIFDIDKFYSDVEAALARHPNVVVAVSEGIRFANGAYVGESSQSGVVDAFGHRYLAGTGKMLEIAVRERFGIKVRSIELSLPQRCAAHLLSATDIRESVRVGRSSVLEALRGESHIMIGIERISSEPYSSRIICSDIFETANRAQGVPDNFINTDGNGVTEAYIDYIMPLINGEIYPKFRNGLPEYYVIK